MDAVLMVLIILLYLGCFSLVMRIEKLEDKIRDLGIRYLEVKDK